MHLDSLKAEQVTFYISLRGIIVFCQVIWVIVKPKTFKWLRERADNQHLYYHKWNNRPKYTIRDHNDTIFFVVFLNDESEPILFLITNMYDASIFHKLVYILKMCVIHYWRYSQSIYPISNTIRCVKSIRIAEFAILKKNYV